MNDSTLFKACANILIPQHENNKNFILHRDKTFTASIYLFFNFIILVYFYVKHDKMFAV